MNTLLTLPLNVIGHRQNTEKWRGGCRHEKTRRNKEKNVLERKINRIVKERNKLEKYREKMNQRENNKRKESREMVEFVQLCGRSLQCQQYGKVKTSSGQKGFYGNTISREFSWRGREGAELRFHTPDLLDEVQQQVNLISVLD